MKNIVVFLVAFSFSSFSGAEFGTHTVPPNTLVCYIPGGGITEEAIVDSSPNNGGLSYITASPPNVVSRVWLTTNKCMARIIPDIVGEPILHPIKYLLYCDNADFDLVYLDIVIKVKLSSGIWSWTEFSSGDKYVSSTMCTVTKYVINGAE